MNERLPHIGVAPLVAGISMVLSGLVSAEVIVNSGVECNGVTELHKSRAEWRQYGIVNSDQTRDMWVSCPLDRVQGLPASPRNFTSALSLFHRGTQDGREAQATCYLVEISAAGIVKARSQSLSLKAGQQTMAGFCDAQPRDFFNSYAFICRLTPGAGISTLMTESHVPGWENSILAEQIGESGATCVDGS